MTFDDLPEALAWLDAHTDFESAMPTRRTRPTLDRMRALAALLGDPQGAYPAVHITGTNGKGSTAAMATALLGAQGLTVGTYTSPNLSRVNERISRNGEPIDDAAFLEVLESLARLEPLMEEPPDPVRAADRGRPGLVRRRGGRRGGGRGRTGRTVGLHERGRRGRGRGHQHQLRPHRGARPHARGHRRDKSGIFKEGSRVVIGETDPTLVDLLRRAAVEVGASAMWARGRTSAAPPTGWRWAAG